MNEIDRIALTAIICDANCALAAIRAINTRAQQQGITLPRLDEKPLLEILTHCAVLRHPARKETSDVQDPANP